MATQKKTQKKTTAKTTKKTTAKTPARRDDHPIDRALEAAPTRAEAAKMVSGSVKTAPRKSTDNDPLFEGPLGTALEAVKNPVYAYVGVNDLALEAVSGIVSDLRRRTEETVADAQRQVSEVPGRVQAMPSEVNALLSRFRADELRKVAEAYVQVAAGIYNGLAARGEDVVARIREENPQIEAGFARVNDSISRAGDVVDESVEMGEEALGTVARQTRSLGVKAAGRVAGGAQAAADVVEDAAHTTAELTGDAAQAAADAVDDAAYDASDEVQSVAGKVEARTGTSARKTPAKKTASTPAKKTTTATKTPAAKTPAKKTTTTTKTTTEVKVPAKKTTTTTTTSTGGTTTSKSTSSN